MTRFFPLLLVLLFFVSACEQEQTLPKPSDIDDQVVLTHDEVLDRIKANMQDGEVFNWTALSDIELFSAGVSGDSLFTFGYWMGDKADAPSQIGLIDTDSDQWKAHFDGILQELLTLESQALGEALTREDLLVFGEPAFVPQATLRLRSLASIEFLRKHQDTRYIEPMGFDPEAAELSQRSGSGCSGGGPNYSIPSADYTTVSPSVKVPWNFYLHNIPQAWAHSQGDNVRVQIIDTGSSDDQDNLGSQFASGWSGGRSISRQSTLYSGSWWWRRLDSPNDSGNQPTYSGGSSCATATTAGVAALVWSKYPGWNRTQVLNRLKQSASIYPNRDNNFGWGAIDALQAVTVPL